ncbi:hypothetical protein TRICI_000813 [Trichomonascus ciferrii]|uniref:Uncharacterized protein n=1 Tax=Trichomonascus ciferrii TaxID=44093 RepID=A0A642VBL1_9ASCO|nr:hypothetical protein TRICI_000813 [Trichomonascus ciferrii]
MQAIQGMIDLFRKEIYRLDENLARFETIDAQSEKCSPLHVKEPESIQTSPGLVALDRPSDQLKPTEKRSLSSLETYRPLNSEGAVTRACIPSKALLQVPKSESRQTLEAEVNDLPEFPSWNYSKQPSINLFPQWTTGLPQDFHPFIFHVICHLLVYKDVYHQKAAIGHLLSQIPLEYYRIRYQLRNDIENYTIKDALLALIAQVPDVEDASSYLADTGPTDIQGTIN